MNYILTQDLLCAKKGDLAIWVKHKKRYEIYVDPTYFIFIDKHTVENSPYFILELSEEAKEIILWKKVGMTCKDFLKIFTKYRAKPLSTNQLKNDK